MVTAFAGTSVAAYVLVRTMCAGPMAVCLIFSAACGLVGAGVFSFVMLLR
jgi:hypothetical protein